MASEALKRAGKALYDDLGIQRELPFSDLPSSMQESYAQMAVVANRAALDPTDEAQVETVAEELYGASRGTWTLLADREKERWRALARLAITALLNHITGDTP